MSYDFIPSFFFFFSASVFIFLMFVCVLAIQSRFNLNRILSGSLLLPSPSPLYDVTVARYNCMFHAVSSTEMEIDKPNEIEKESHNQKESERCVCTTRQTELSQAKPKRKTYKYTKTLRQRRHLFSCQRSTHHAIQKNQWKDNIILQNFYTMALFVVFRHRLKKIFSFLSFATFSSLSPIACSFNSLDSTLNCLSIVCQHKNKNGLKWYKYLSWSEIWIVWFELNSGNSARKKRETKWSTFLPLFRTFNWWKCSFS